jgi:hypothetical protein
MSDSRCLAHRRFELVDYDVQFGRSQIQVTASERKVFFEPIERWLDVPYDSHAKFCAYKYLMLIAEITILQLGRKGDYAVKLLASRRCS